MAARVDGATVDPDLVFDVGEGAGVSVDLAHLDVDGRLRRNIDPVGEGSGWLGWLRSRGEGLEFLDPAYRWLVIGSAQAIDPYGDGLDGLERRAPLPIGVPAHLSDGHRRIRRLQHHGEVAQGIRVASEEPHLTNQGRLGELDSVPGHPLLTVVIAPLVLARPRHAVDARPEAIAVTRFAGARTRCG